MLSLTLNCLLAFGLSLTSSVRAQSTDVATTTADSSDSGYVGYNLTLEGDEDSVIYSTENTRSNASLTYPDPDVFLNASVSVEEINIEVDNLTAKINLDLQVLELLQFNAGVDLSIDKVQLLIQNVSARVLLEARLENLVGMVDNVLESLDLNPIIATLGQGVSDIVNSTTDALGGVLGGDSSSSSSASSSSSSSQATKRSFELENNILFSINDFSGNSHTNRVLAQNGDIVEQDLDNDGRVSGSRVVGSYLKDMTFTGHEETVDGVLSKQYKYEPIHGVQAVAAVFFEASGEVKGTQILSELEAGGFATIAADDVTIFLKRDSFWEKYSKRPTALVSGQAQSMDIRPFHSVLRALDGRVNSMARTVNEEIQVVIGSVQVEDAKVMKQQTEVTVVLGVLAAIYLLLTLVTGILGMNTNEIMVSLIGFGLSRYGAGFSV
ncbi:hypothetical protein MBLNU13_g08562t1 [Cladosporium sp. NU13]